MRQVALISQTLRAGHCQAYMDAHPGDNLILTPDPSVFAEVPLEDSITVVAANPPPELLPRTNLARTRIFRSALTKARGGSSLGQWLERNAKHAVRRVRRFRKTTRPVSPRPALDERTIRSSEMYHVLVEQHSLLAIDRLVVFDVFDLPVALAFAQDHDIEVLVR